MAARVRRHDADDRAVPAKWPERARGDARTSPQAFRQLCAQRAAQRPGDRRMNALYECVGIQKRFGDFVATDGIDLTIRDREMIGIIGANGAGKTTLINNISGYLRPNAGKLLLRGADITGEPPRALARKGIARSFQIPQLFARSTALE